MKTGPRISIGMPVYNGERFLRQSLDAILGQTFRDFELIISDNCSTDGTSEICRTYASRDVRVKYIRNEANIGASRNFNRVFELARGEYFRWAPADDLFAQDSLARCIEVLDTHPEVALCYPKTVLIDDEGNVIKPYHDNLDLRLECPAQRFREAIMRIGLVNVIYGLIRSDVLRRTSLIKNYPGSDTMLVIELTLYGQFWEIPQQLFLRRMHAHASSSIKSVEGLQEFFDPRTRGKLFLPCWRRQGEYALAIARAPLDLRNRLAAFWVVCQLAGWSRHTLMQELVRALRYVRHLWATPAALPRP